MIKFNKDYSSNFIELIVSIFFLSTSTLYACSLSTYRNSLRLHIGAKDGDDTYGRIDETNSLFSNLPSQQLTKGVVREGFLKPGLKVIKDDETFNACASIYLDYNVIGVYAIGFYVNKKYGLKSTNVKERELYDRIFGYLENKYQLSFDRVVVVPARSRDTNTLHEILHDVIELSSERKKEIFMSLADFMYFLSNRSKETGRSYSSLSRGTLGIARRDQDYRLRMLKEFIPKFFSGELEGVDSEYEYILHNMPIQGKTLFYELGFIWPETDIDGFKAMEPIGGFGIQGHRSNL